MASADPAKDSLLTLASLVYPFHLPKGKKSITYAKSFIVSDMPQDTVRALEMADQQRNQFLDEVLAPRENPAAIAVAAERYIPSLHRIITSIDASHDPVRLTQRMQFAWTSALNAQSTECKVQEVFIFEMAMVMSTKALAQVATAAATVDPTVDRFADAANLLRGAAAIFTALAQDFLPRWKETVETAASRHPETSEGVAMAMVDLCVAQAQMMYVCKAVFLGTTPMSLLAKLAVAVSEKLDKCVSNFRARAGTHYCRLEPDFLTYLTFMTTYYRGLAYRFLAVSHWDKGDYGTGIGLLQFSTQYLRTRTDVSSVGLPAVHDSPLLGRLQSHLTVVKDDTRALLASWTSDNNKIYFAAVPDADSLPTLPSGATMVKVDKFDYASKLPDLIFVEHRPADLPPPPPPSNSNGSQGAGGEELGGRQRSDSDLARELQEKLNMGQEV